MDLIITVLIIVVGLINIVAIPIILRAQVTVMLSAPRPPCPAKVIR